MGQILVHRMPSQTTIDAARELLRQAESGEAVGFAVAVMLKGKQYYVEACGEALTNPTFATGMLFPLALELYQTVQQRAESDSTY